ncbi:MAG: cysteine--tRNA ligase [Candidatus Coatesbacteria bacterium]|nr:MAG: cysteine--tRNA ligase [Candidatus Coatesbacteria bacterium]RLC42006.1 MAG: cysteine--tRNA ligase [Candidatus Coatesbacteria bacterium]
MRFYNTLIKSVEEFSPLEGDVVKMYTCGPTVYDYAHIGNFRTYVFEDILRRWLKFRGYKVIQVMNITDVDDKTIMGANEKGISLDEYTREYTNAFFEDIDTLRIERAEHYPRATEHINEMIALIEKLIEKGIAYVADDGIYYSIAKFPEYGKLSGFDVKSVKAGARVAKDEYDKEDVRDFALWKFRRPDEPFWSAPFGDGRPGWHIECSAMSMKYLGETFDIHIGGVDNIFPHHENEIAQSEGATGKKFVRYWLHSEHLIVEGRKMSKSLGNFYTLRDLLSMGYNPIAIRYLLLSTHYRKQLNFTFDGLKGAYSTVMRLWDTIGRLESISDLSVDNKVKPKVRDMIDRMVKGFTEEMDDDLNISPALAHLFDFIRDVNSTIDRGELGSADASEILKALQSIDTVLDVMTPIEEEIPSEIMEMVEKRERAREMKDFGLADRIREEVFNLGYIIEDTKDGPKVKKKI